MRNQRGECRRYRTPISLFLLLSCLSSLLLLAQTPPGTVPYGGTVVIGMKGDFDTLSELHTSDSDALEVIQNLLFMTLTRLDSNLQFIPYLAESWAFSEGDRVLTYHLRKDITWSDGTPTTAEDVLFTYRLAIDTAVAYPAASRFDLTEKVEVEDRFTVRFHFKQPYPDGLYDTRIPILPKHILEKYPAAQLKEAPFNRQPVSNGPFQLLRWKRNYEAVFKANPDFAPGRPYLDYLVFRIIPDETILLSELLTGKIDLIPSLTPNGYREVAAAASLQALRYSGREYQFIAWNLQRPLFGNTERRALAYAINKPEMIATLLEGLATPAVGPLLPFSWAFDENLQDIPYDPATARRLLREAGWQDADGDGILEKDGQPFEFALKTNAASQLRKDIAVMVQAYLKQIGVLVQVETVEWNLLLEQVFSHDFGALILGWSADFTVNPTDVWHSSAMAEGYNFIAYHNPKVDSLLEKGRAISRPELAKPVWAEFQKTVLEDNPYYFLFIADKLVGYNRRLRDVRIDVRGYLRNVGRWWIPRDQRKFN